MNEAKIRQIIENTAFVRTGGSEEELRAAKYLQDVCHELGLKAELMPFEVDLADISLAELIVDGKSIPCKGYLCGGSGEIEAPFYYLTESDPYSLSNCKGKIVLFDGFLGYWKYQDLLANGAVGFISYDGHVNYPDRDMDQRELRSYVSCGNKIPGVNINAKDAIELVKNGSKNAVIRLQQREYKGNSHNLMVTLPGETDETIIFTAHYDSISLSKGSYDNMSGSIGLLAMAEYFNDHPHRYTLRFLWCGSEERGLLGSKAYCAAQKEALEQTVLNINLDMIGCIMGKFIACCTTENKLVDYLSYFGDEMGFQIKAYQDVYSSDSTPFADQGVPAVSFARIAPPNTATIHNRYDTPDLMSDRQMVSDIRFITAFADRMANAKKCPVSKEIPEEMKTKLDEYLCRKRKKG